MDDAEIAQLITRLNQEADDVCRLPEERLESAARLAGIYDSFGLTDDMDISWTADPSSLELVHPEARRRDAIKFEIEKGRGLRVRAEQEAAYLRPEAGRARAAHRANVVNGKKGGRPKGATADAALTISDMKRRALFYQGVLRENCENKAAAARETRAEYWSGPPLGEKALQRLIVKLDNWSSGRFPSRDL